VALKFAPLIKSVKIIKNDLKEKSELIPFSTFKIFFKKKFPST